MKTASAGRDGKKKRKIATSNRNSKERIEGGKIT
jgi:hypothetical protein